MNDDFWQKLARGGAIFLCLFAITNAILWPSNETPSIKTMEYKRVVRSMPTPPASPPDKPSPVIESLEIKPKKWLPAPPVHPIPTNSIKVEVSVTNFAGSRFGKEFIEKRSYPLKAGEKYVLQIPPGHELVYVEEPSFRILVSGRSDPNPWMPKKVYDTLSDQYPVSTISFETFEMNTVAVETKLYRIQTNKQAAVKPTYPDDPNDPRLDYVETREITLEPKGTFHYHIPLHQYVAVTRPNNRLILMYPSPNGNGEMINAAEYKAKGYNYSMDSMAVVSQSDRVEKFEMKIFKRNDK